MEKTKQPFSLSSPPVTGGGNEESEHFPTPLSLAAAGLEEAIKICPACYENRPVTLMEPGCGDNAPFLDASTIYPVIRRVGQDIRKIEIPDCVLAHNWFPDTDYLDWTPQPGEEPDLIVTNPPFTLAQRFVEHSLEIIKPTGVVMMLLQTGFEGSKERVDFWKKHVAMKRIILTPRPVFIGSSGDSREYAFYIWPGKSLDKMLAGLGRRYTEMTTLNNGSKWR